ncbi:MAG: hypothetical protein HQ515_11915 [Phycisphaeraceae bacterium]|nr:hypothetical protein [Phycisphaeraceae bacterium]
MRRILTCLMFVFVATVVLLTLTGCTASDYREMGTAYWNDAQYEQAYNNYLLAQQMDASTTVKVPSGRQPVALSIATAANLRGVELADTNDESKAQEAIVWYTKAIAADPTFIHPYTNRGVSYSNDDKYDLSYADWLKASQIDPTKTVKSAGGLILCSAAAAQSAYYQGETLKQNQPTAAIEWYQKAIAADPSHAWSYPALGRLYLQAENTAAAEQAMTNHLEKGQPAVARYLPFRKEYGLLIFDESKREQKIAELKSDAAAAETQGDNLVALDKHARVYALMIDKAQDSAIYDAIIRCIKAAGVMPKPYPEVQRYRVQAAAYLKAGRDADALDAFKRSTYICFWDTRSTYNAAILMAKVGHQAIIDRDALPADQTSQRDSLAEGSKANFGAAKSWMELYMRITPSEVADAKKAQDLVYEWEALSK